MTSATKIPKKSRYHHGDLRAQLIEATRQLVEQRGPDNFSVSEACRLAGVSTAAPYKHFKDKGEMLLAVSADGMQRQQMQIFSALEPLPPSDLSRIIAMGRCYVNFAQNEPGVFRLMFGLTEDHGDDQPLQELGENTFGFVQREVADYLGEAEITSDVEKRAFMLWSFVHGLSFLLIDGKMEEKCGDYDVEAYLVEIAERVMR